MTTATIPIFTRVGTYVQHGSKFCFVFVVLLGATLVRIMQFLRKQD
jgi:hypothetical protein